MADVRNTLTRNKDTLHLRRALIIGAGHSGAIAAWLHTHSCPGSRIVVVDTAEDRARRASEIEGGSITPSLSLQELCGIVNREFETRPDLVDRPQLVLNRFGEAAQ